MNQAENANRTKEILDDLELEIENLESAIAEWKELEYEPYTSIGRRLVLANNRLAILVAKYHIKG